MGNRSDHETKAKRRRRDKKKRTSQKSGKSEESESESSGSTVSNQTGGSYTKDEEMNKLLEASRKDVFSRYVFDNLFDENGYDGQGCLVWTVILSDVKEDVTEVGILVNGKPCSFPVKFSGPTRPLKGWIVKARLKQFDQDMRIEADLVSDFAWPNKDKVASESTNDKEETDEDLHAE